MNWTIWQKAAKFVVWDGGELYYKKKKKKVRCRLVKI